MGYEIHITRKREWWLEDGPEITEDEWRNFVANDPELEITGIAEAKAPDGSLIQMMHPLLTKWNGHSSGEPVWLSYFKGSFSIKNPDDECLLKADSIAKALRSRVQGDNGEWYVDGKIEEPAPVATSILDRTIQRISLLWTGSIQPAQPPTLEFGVGDRVQDLWGNEHTVLLIDLEAEHGLGLILTRRSDGTEHRHATIAHGLKKKPKKRTDSN